VVFEAGRKSVEAAEAARQQRAEQMAKDPTMARASRRKRPPVPISGGAFVQSQPLSTEDNTTSRYVCVMKLRIAVEHILTSLRLP
jgi:hypothetical protein